MKNDETEIKEFFDQIRETEWKETEIPQFELPKKKRKSPLVRYLLPLSGVAAALLFFFGIDWDKEVVTTEENTLVITMTIGEPMNTDDFLSEESSMNNWKSPSDILIQEFEE